MSIIQQWFKNLRRPPRVREQDYGAPYDERERMTERDHQAYHIRSLKIALASALTERKTCTREDFQAQLTQFMGALRADDEQRRLGAFANPTITVLTRDNFSRQYAQLLFLAFDTIDTTPEEAATKVEAYLAQMSATD